MAVLRLHNLDYDENENIYFADHFNVAWRLNMDNDLSDLFAAFGASFSGCSAVLPQSSTFERNWVSQSNVRLISARDYWVMPGTISMTPSFHFATNTYYQYKNGRYVYVVDNISTYTYRIYEPLDPDNPNVATDTMVYAQDFPSIDRDVVGYSIPSNISELTINEFNAAVVKAHIFTRGFDENYVVNNWEGFSEQSNDLSWVYYLTYGTDLDPEKDDPYSGDDSPYNPSSPGGGDGGGDNPYDRGDSVPVPDLPPVSICDTGLITLYTPSAVQLNLLGADLWSSNFVNSMVKDLYADPMDVIINVGIVPFNVVPAGVKNIKVGERDTGISSNYPANNYINFKMGVVDFKSTLGAYIDYAPYTKADIYIPYVGYVPLDVDAFMDTTIGLEYNIDLATGSAIAFLTCNGDVWQQFACNLKTMVPLSAANYSQMWTSLLSAACAAGIGTAAGVASAGAAGAAESAEIAKGGSDIVQRAGASAASDIATAITSKPAIQKSNALDATGGLLGNRCAYLEIQRPNLALPDNQCDYIGYPSYVSMPLSSVQGFTRVSSIHLGIAGATSKELAEIEAALKTGVIIENNTPISGSGIVLLNNSSANNVINKDMTSVATLVGHFRDDVDIVHPVVRIERSSAIGFNYVYISDFGRYYYVDEIKAYSNNILELSLSVDALQSFAAAILGHTAIIDKQRGKNAYNLYLNDDSLKMYQNPLIQLKLFENSFWDDFEFVLVVAGH